MLTTRTYLERLQTYFSKRKGDSESGLGVCREWNWCGGPGQDACW